MLRKNFSRKIEIDIILKYLELATKVVAIIIIVATVIGGLNIYSYLKDIDHLFLFSDVVGISYASISALFAYFLLIIAIAIGFLSPFLLTLILLVLVNADKQNNNRQIKNIKNKEIDHESVFNPDQKLVDVFNFIKDLILAVLITLSIPLLIAIPLLGALAPLFLLCILTGFLIEKLFFSTQKRLSNNTLSKFIHSTSFACTLISLLILFFDGSYAIITSYVNLIFFILFSFLYILLFLKRNKKAINIEKLCLIFVLSIIQVLLFSLYFSFVIVPTIGMFKENDALTILFFVLSAFFLGVSYLFSHTSFSDFSKGGFTNAGGGYNIVFVVLSLAIAMIYAVIIGIVSNFNFSLYAPKFIEKPQNSSWYLIHNGNTTSENINGLSKRDILAQKDIFNAKDCTTLKNKDSEKKCQDDNKDIFNNRENALYGYMAWNLGNTKVFCPVSVDFFDDKDNTEKSEKCLVIDGKHLQLISKHHLQQPGG